MVRGEHPRSRPQPYPGNTTPRSRAKRRRRKKEMRRTTNPKGVGERAPRRFDASRWRGCQTSPRQGRGAVPRRFGTSWRTGRHVGWPDVAESGEGCCAAPHRAMAGAVVEASKQEQQTTRAAARMQLPGGAARTQSPEAAVRRAAPGAAGRAPMPGAAVRVQALGVAGGARQPGERCEVDGGAEKKDGRRPRSAASGKG
jgi:hypothetical protein